MNERILIVDDEESICEILRFNLEVEGYDVESASSAEEAMGLDITSYSLILLDVMMGGKSGFKMASELKRNPQTSQIPIIFCSAMDSEESKVAGLTIGADDYIAKPFSVREVVARVKSVLRRCAVSAAPKASVTTESDPVRELLFNGLKLDLMRHKCYVDGEEVSLTKTELEILTLLLKNRGRVFSRDEILRNIWSDQVIVLDRTIDVNITRLRKKIGEYGRFIVTSQGYGYGFDL